MNYLKKIGLSLLYIIGITLVSTFLITLLNYFNIIKTVTATKNSKLNTCNIFNSEFLHYNYYLL